MPRCSLTLLLLLAPVYATLSFPDLPALALSPQVPAFSFDLYSALPPATSTLTALPDLPGDCAPYVGPGKECTANMTATNVEFEDCGDPFTVCRCSDATMNMNTVRDYLGRVPVGLRRYIGVVVVLNDTEPHAYTLVNGDIHLFGDCKMDTWVHEASHAFDYSTSNAPLSGTSGWIRAISDDSCAPDNYSLTNRVEDFAQVSVLKTYSLLHNGLLPPGEFQSGCMQNQINFMSALPLFNASTLFGNTCDIIGGLPPRHDVPPRTLDSMRTFSTVLADVATSPTSPRSSPTALLHDHTVDADGAPASRPMQWILPGILLAVLGMRI